MANNNNNNSAKQCFCQTIRTESEEASAITCANCQRAIHLSCANLLPHQAAELQAYYCCSCLPYTGPSIPKPITNSHRHNRVEPNPETLPIQTGNNQKKKHRQCYAHWTSQVVVNLSNLFANLC